ncbi:hypothetical protein O3P69_005671 [Scylla paramamosain]|uniref:Transmembrane protein n=1 Tax=Scylla paramamosain TaxID=85552 RepID=A0AAW0UAK0_SCYPA
MEFTPIAVRYAELWCECAGNSSSVPHRLLMHEQMQRLHAQARQHALWYVVVVLVVYVAGLVVIIRRSGRVERNNAVAVVSSCCVKLGACVTQCCGRLFGRPGQGKDKGTLQETCADSSEVVVESAWTWMFTHFSRKHRRVALLRSATSSQEQTQQPPRRPTTRSPQSPHHSSRSQRKTRSGCRGCKERRTKGTRLQRCRDVGTSLSDGLTPSRSAQSRQL